MYSQPLCKYFILLVTMYMYIQYMIVRLTTKIHVYTNYKSGSTVYHALHFWSSSPRKGTQGGLMVLSFST